MTGISRSIGAFTLAAGLGLVVLAAPQRRRLRRRTAPPPAQQPSDVTTTISGGPGAPTRVAVPDFIALSADAETVTIAKMIAQVLYRRPDLRAGIRADSARHLQHDRRRAIVRRRAVRPMARTGRRWRRRGHGPESWRRHSCGGPALQREDARAGIRQGIRRIGRQPAALRAHGVRRAPPDPARASRRGPVEAGLRLGSRWRTHGQHDREPERAGDLHRRLRWRRPEAGHDRPFAEHSAQLVAGRTLALPTRRTGAVCRIFSSRISTRARSTSSRRPRSRRKTSSRPGRRTERGSRSGRHATATPSCTLRTATAPTSAASRRIPASTSRPPGRLPASSWPSFPIGRDRRRSIRLAPTAWGCAGSRPATPMPRGRRGPRCRSTRSPTRRASVPATTSR